VRVLLPVDRTVGIDGGRGGRRRSHERAAYLSAQAALQK
jgi:hypothetical protein